MSIANAASGNTYVTDGAWHVVTTRAVGFADDLDQSLKDVQIVYREVDGQWRSWLMVTQSATLRRIGIVQNGLYALKDFHGPRETRFSMIAGEKLGRYNGQILGTFESSATIDTTQWMKEGRRFLLSYSVSRGKGVSVVDGYDSGPPFLWRINDAINTGLEPNARFGSTGYASASKDIPMADMSATTIDSIINSEVTVSYGRGYWTCH